MKPPLVLGIVLESVDEIALKLLPAFEFIDLQGRTTEQAASIEFGKLHQAFLKIDHGQIIGV